MTTKGKLPTLDDIFDGLAAGTKSLSSQAYDALIMEGWFDHTSSSVTHDHGLSGWTLPEDARAEDPLRRYSNDPLEERRSDREKQRVVAAQEQPHELDLER